MATMETITEALKLIADKKALLRQAFEDLQSHSNYSFSLSWADLDNHFSALQSTVESKFSLLKSQPSDHHKAERQPLDNANKELAPVGNGKGVEARPEVKGFCEKMDGVGLRDYISFYRPKERSIIRNELPDAFKCASDAAAMVLDALEGFIKPFPKGGKDTKLANMRKACIIMFEALMESKVKISPEVRERAKTLALDWKEKVRLDDECVFESYGFLHLVASYGLVDVFGMNDLFDMAVIVATRFLESVPLIRMLGFGDKTSELIQKLISKGRQLQAVKFVLELELADKFPPVNLLQDLVDDAKKNAQKTRKDGKSSRQSQNEAMTKEVVALTSALKLIEDRKIEADLLKQSIIKRIEVLEKQKADSKKQKQQPVPSSAPKSQPQNSGTKRPHATTKTQTPKRVALASSANTSTVPTFANSHSHTYNASSTAQAYQPQNHNGSSTVQAFQPPNPQFVPGGLVPNVASTTNSSGQTYQQPFVQHNVAIAGEAFPGYQQSYFQPAGPLPDHHTQYPSSQNAAYGLAGAAAVAPYASSSAEALYGSTEASLAPHMPAHQPDPNMASGYYNGSVNYGGYAMPPQYHQAYQPQ